MLHEIAPMRLESHRLCGAAVRSTAPRSCRLDRRSSKVIGSLLYINMIDHMIFILVIREMDRRSGPRRLAPYQTFSRVAAICWRGDF